MRIFTVINDKYQKTYPVVFTIIKVHLERKDLVLQRQDLGNRTVQTIRVFWYYKPKPGLCKDQLEIRLGEQAL
jgi:hypothetical protein